MNATILNGALAGDGFVDGVQELLAGQLAAAGCQVRTWTLRDEKMAYCLGCFECWTRYPGLCRIDDAGREVTASLIGSDLVIYLSPVTFGGYSSELKKALDRSICLVMPFFTRIDGEVHHRPRYERYPGLVGVGVLPAADPEQERIFAALLGRNALNLHAPFNAAGFVYRNQQAGMIRTRLNHLLREIGLAQPQLAPEVMA